MGSRLQSPGNGDIVFETNTPNAENRKLYAWKVVLSTQSDYYATSKPSCFRNIDQLQVFKSSFAEGDLNNGVSASNLDDRSLRRTHVQVDDDFDLLHNILYYLHTNQISFGTDLTDDQPRAAHLPKLCPAEDIYAMADRLLLDDLKKKAFDFLKLTCSVENITARTMSKFARLYKDVGDMYATYYRMNWKQVKTTAAHREFFAERDSEGDVKEIIALLKRYRVVMEDPSWL